MSRRTALYLRISQDRYQTELGVSRQREVCGETAGQRGLVIDVEFVDNDTSATGGKERRDFEALMEGIEDRTVGTIVAISMERLLRSNRDKYRLLEACQAHEVNIILSRGTDIDMRTAVGRMVADQLATAARFEVELKGERQRLQRDQEARSGRAPAAPRAFGYTARLRVPSERWGRVYLQAEEAPLVAEAYRQVIDGRSMGAIARWLNEQGSTTPSGRPWTHHNLHSVLVNPKYKAVRGVRQLLPGREGMAGKRTRYHVEMGEAEWPAIVSAETWDAAQTVLRDPGRRKNHPVNEKGARYLLPFLARCATCGSHCVTGSRSYPAVEGRVQDRLLRCASGRHVCRKAGPVEEFVEEILLARFEDPRVRSILARRRVSDVDLDTLKADRVRLESQLEDARAKARTGAITLDDFAAFRADWEPQLGKVRDQLTVAFRRDPVLELASTADVRALWEAWPMDTKRALVAARLDVVVHPGRPGRPGGRRFDPDTVEVRWR